MSAVDAFSAPDDPVLLHSPTYIGFTNILENNGRKIIHSDLVRDEAGVWRMDYDEMDAKLINPEIQCQAPESKLIIC
jgi:cystathionine beta-lyase